ncbi:MAG: hypothetical protein Q7R64_03305 [bacterium]|nr:hypothetical protein [bacterium]
MKAILLLNITFAIRDRSGKRRPDVEETIRSYLGYKQISVPTLEHLQPGMTIRDGADKRFAIVTEIASAFDGKFSQPIIRAEVALEPAEFSAVTGYTVDWLEDGGFEALLLLKKRRDFLGSGYVLGFEERLAAANRHLYNYVKRYCAEMGVEPFRSFEYKEENATTTKA